MNARPWMDDDARAVRDTATRFFETECVPHEARWAAQRHADRDVWRRAGALGLLCASVPAEYGGAGAGFAAEAAICDAQAYALAAQFSISVHAGIVAGYLLDYGSEAQKRAWLPRMATGELVAAIAMTEPGAGTDLRAMRTTAVRDGDTYRIDGAKTFITNGWHADLLCLAVRTDAAAGGRGLSLVMLELDGLSGFTRNRPLEKIGQLGQDTAELFFDDVRVPCANLLGPREGEGFAQLRAHLPRERAMIAIAAAAAMRRALDETVRYAKTRTAFGAPLLAMQNTRFALAECATLANVAETFVDRCVLAEIDGTLDDATAAQVKWWATDTLCRVADACLQVFGGNGFMRDYPIARIWTDARSGRIYGGTNEIMKEIIARELERTA